MPACGMFWVLVSWQGEVLCLSSSFQAGSSRQFLSAVTICVRKLLPSWHVSTPFRLNSGVSFLGTLCGDTL
jgi:hypothetical protein